MFDTARAAVEAALAGGAVYADARVVSSRREELLGRNGEIEAADRSEAAGVGVRALVGSSWGFAATSDLEAAESAGFRAAAIAHASALVPGPTSISPRSPLCRIGMSLRWWRTHSRFPCPRRRT